MNTQIKTLGGLSLTPAISDYIEKRITSIEKFANEDSTTFCHVDIAKTSSHHKHGDIFKAEIRITTKGQEFYASSEKDDLYAAIDETRDEIARKLKSSKEKRISFVRRGGAKVKNIIKGFWGGEKDNS